MNFRRTSQGLSNQRLFFNVDALVFVEGGTGFTKEEVLDGQFNRDSIDIKFWRGIFSIFRKNERVQFRAIGSKSTLREIAIDIQTGDIRNVYVAMDRDFDNLKETQINCNKVIYTYGYSWENDVWQKDVLQDVLNTICAVDCREVMIKNEIYQLFDSFNENIKVAVYADAYLGVSGGSFFNRSNYLRYLKFKPKKMPVVDLERVRREIQDCALSKSEINEFGGRNDIQVQKDCLGHFLADFCFHVAVYIRQRIGNLPPLAKHYFNCIGIDKFVNRLSGGCFESIYRHYENSFAYF